MISLKNSMQLFHDLLNKILYKALSTKLITNPKKGGENCVHCFHEIMCLKIK